MSDESTLAQEAVERQAHVEDVIDAITAARGGKPAAVTVQRPHPTLRLNGATGEVTYLNSREAEAAAQSDVPQDGDDDIPGNLNLADAQKRLVGELQREQARLDEHTFHPVTGEKVYKVAGRDREVLKMKVDQLAQEAVEQHERYSRALAARAAKTEQGNRDIEADSMATEWVQGNPQRKAMLAKAIEEFEARSLAEVIVRRRMGLMD